MRRNSTFVVIVVGCLLAATVGVLGLAAQGRGRGKVSLIGTFRDSFADRIMSDFQGPYIDREGVVVSISGNGGFRLDINSSGRKGIRNFKLNFSDCVSDPADCRPPFTEALVGTTVGSFAILGVVRGVGDLGVGQSAMLNARVIVRDVVDPDDGEVEEWFLEFRTFDDPDNVCFGSGSGQLLVRHPDADTWEIEASTTNLACLRSRASKPGGDSSIEFHGTYDMPFKLTLTRKP